jgi:hypothetical protein
VISSGEESNYSEEMHNIANDQDDDDVNDHSFEREEDENEEYYYDENGERGMPAHHVRSR